MPRETRGWTSPPGLEPGPAWLAAPAPLRLRLCPEPRATRWWRHLYARQAVPARCAGRSCLQRCLPQSSHLWPRSRVWWSFQTQDTLQRQLQVPPSASSLQSLLKAGLGRNLYKSKCSSFVLSSVFKFSVVFFPRGFVLYSTLFLKT